MLQVKLQLFAVWTWLPARRGCCNSHVEQGADSVVLRGPVAGKHVKGSPSCRQTGQEPLGGPAIDSIYNTVTHSKVVCASMHI